jgi:phosphoglycerol transferase
MKEDSLKKQSFYRDTIVIISGDHQFMSNNIGPIDIPNNFQRTIYNVFLNTEYNITDIDKMRTCTTMDIAPTILDILGFTLPDDRFGLGVSLLSANSNLLETYGIEYINEELQKRSLLYEKFF